MIYKTIVSKRDYIGFFKKGALKHVVCDFRIFDRGNVEIVLEMNENDIKTYLELGLDYLNLIPCSKSALKEKIKETEFEMYRMNVDTTLYQKLDNYLWLCKRELEKSQYNI